ncbi:N-acetylmuramoyl-L-alanine amidase [Stomatohabitans albus]|uniref:N-acetylmuramoyl-L-alanine amidase n=1 Tax=Stomatohabitans albus TaxID=3110766 RepID=UPI00300CC063
MISSPRFLSPIALCVALLCLVLTGCASTPAPIVTTTPSSSPSASTSTASWQGAPTPTPTPIATSSPSTHLQAPQSPDATTTSNHPVAPIPQSSEPKTIQPLQGLRVVLDPGHNGGNFSHTKDIAKQVPDGRGGTKNCNTTGTATSSGYRESTFNWEVSQRVKTYLEQRGAVVSLTRTSDDGVGPCVNERGAAGNGADVLVSIHANGSDNPNVRGWFILHSSAPLNHNQDNPSRLLAGHIAETLKNQGFPTNPSGPFSPRSDIATINHSGAPVVMLELLEMKNPDEAALAQSPAGQERYATAIADGIEHWAGDPRRNE